MRPEDLTMSLADGRTLAWAEYGVPEGRSVLFFHGGNDSRLAGRLLDDAATRAEVRLICPDRPGYGASTFLAGRTIPGLRIRRQSPRRRAGDRRLRDRGSLRRRPPRPRLCTCQSGACPLGGDRVVAGTARLPQSRTSPGIPVHEPPLQVTDALPTDGEEPAQEDGHVTGTLAVGVGRMQPADGELFRRQPEMAQEIIAEMTEGARQGVSGIVHEASLYHAGWGFGLRGVATSSQVWHGRRDREAAMGWQRVPRRGTTPCESAHPHGGRTLLHPHQQRPGDPHRYRLRFVANPAAAA